MYRKGKVNKFPFWPTRVCLNTSGNPVSRNIAMTISISSGEARSRSAAAAEQPNTRLASLMSDFVHFDGFLKSTA